MPLKKGFGSLYQPSLNLPSNPGFTEGTPYFRISALVFHRVFHSSVMIWNGKSNTKQTIPAVICSAIEGKVGAPPKVNGFALLKSRSYSFKLANYSKIIDGSG